MSDGFTRRSVLCAAVVGGLLTACGTSAPKRAGGVGSAKPGDRLAALAAVPQGGGVLVDVQGNGQLLLVRSADGQVRAFNPACPHQGTTVEPPTAGVITCPTHKSTFDPATGEVRTGPSTKGLTEIPISVEGDAVLLG